MSKRTWALIAGGGTGGHVTPAIAVAGALVEAGVPADSISFVGSRRGIETELVPDAGYELIALPGRGIERRLSWRAIGAAVALAVGVVVGIGLVVWRRPAVVVSVGGYAAVPCIAGAALTRVPVVIAESNAVPGLANRIAGRVCRSASAVTFPGTPLPRATVTGNPVRSEVAALDRPGHRADARRDLGVPLDRTLVLVVGGSLGARRINRAVGGALSGLGHRADLAVHHVVGLRDWSEFGDLSLDAGAALRYTTAPFEQRLHRWYQAADLVVARAGASTVAELACAGLPSILVPLPGAPGDHQSANAEVLGEAGAARVLRDADLDGPTLAAAVTALVDEPDRLGDMGRAAAALARPDAAAAVAALVLAHARRAPGRTGDAECRTVGGGG